MYDLLFYVITAHQSQLGASGTPQFGEYCETEGNGEDKETG